MKIIHIILCLLTLTARAEFVFTTNSPDTNTITIIGYYGVVTNIPSSLDGKTVVNIGTSAFLSCNSLIDITIPNGVTNIGRDAFDNCIGLMNIEMGSNLLSMGKSPFSYCLSLTNILVDEENLLYSSSNGVLFNKSQTELIQYPLGRIGSFIIPNSVIAIGQHSFSRSPGITSLKIGSGITNFYTFDISCCGNLMEILVDSNNSFYSSSNGVLFDKSQTKLILYPGGRIEEYVIPDKVTSIGNDSFRELPGPSSVIIGSGVTNIGSFAFYLCTNLTRIIIPDNVKTIGMGAFSKCYGLTAAEIGRGVDNIKDQGFRYCTSLTNIRFKGNAPKIEDHDNFKEVPATVFHLPPPSVYGWPGPPNLWSGLPTALWLPIMTNGNFISQDGRFGFNIDWTSGQTVIIESSTNLNSGWISISTNTFYGDSMFFEIPYLNQTKAFYRICQ